MRFRVRDLGVLDLGLRVWDLRAVQARAFAAWGLGYKASRCLPVWVQPQECSVHDNVIRTNSSTAAITKLTTILIHTRLMTHEIKGNYRWGV